MYVYHIQLYIWVTVGIDKCTQNTLNHGTKIRSVANNILFYVIYTF